MKKHLVILAALLALLSACTLRPELTPGNNGSGNGSGSGNGTGGTTAGAISLIYTGPAIYTGSLLSFKWADAAAANFVRLDLFRNGNFETMFLNYAPNAGSYTWSIPVALNLSDADMFSAKLTVYDNVVNPTIIAQLYSANFQIKQNASNNSGLSDVVVNAASINLTMTDNGALVDGDMVSVGVNGATIVPSLTLTGGGTIVPVSLTAGLNTLSITALNEGSSPPNTAELQISNVTSGSATQDWRLLSGQVGTLKIWYQP